MNEEKEKISAGIYEQLKNNPHQRIQYPLTKEKILETIKEVFNIEKENVFEWKHNTWEENREKFSAWTFKTENSSFTTGDVGKEEFDKLYRRNKEIY